MEAVFIDSHLHFDSFAATGQVDELLERAGTAGVRQMMAIGGTAEANALAVRLSTEHAGRVFAAVGYDRDEVGKEIDAQSLRAWLAMPSVVAVGETGLDYHYSPETAPAQRELFGSMLALARDVAKPTVIHSRETDDDTATMLQEHLRAWKGDPARVGVLHCFTGSLAFAKRLLDLGLYIGISGIVTFKNAEGLREVARYVPVDRLLIETDAPYLAPVPHRGKTNEPAYVVHVAGALATLRGTGLQDIADQTAENARRLFGFRKEPIS